MNDAPSNHAVFSMNAALNSALLTLNAGRVDAAPGLDREGAYLYARGLRHEVLANNRGISELFAPYLIAGIVFAGLESRSIPRQPQELLAAIEFVCLEESSSWNPRPLYARILQRMSEPDLTRALVLVCAGALAGVADAIRSTPVTTVARTIRAALELNRKLEKAAASLKVSPRSLQRRLTQSGTDFGTIRDATLNGLAIELLQQTDRSVASIARTLGYADPAAFSIAFKRWNGVPPATYRAAGPPAGHG